MAKLTSVKSQSVYHSTAIKTNSKARTSSNSSSKTTSSSSKSSTSRKVSPQQAKKNYEQAMSRVKGNAVKATNGKTSNSPKPSNVKKDSFTKTNEKTKTEKQAVITQKAYSKAVSTAKTQSKPLSKEISDPLVSLAIKNSGISINSDGTPRINNGSDARIYSDALKKLKGNENKIKAAKLAGIPVDSYGNPKINSASDAKAYTNALSSINKCKEKNKYHVELDLPNAIGKGYGNEYDVLLGKTFDPIQSMTQCNQKEIRDIYEGGSGLVYADDNGYLRVKMGKSEQSNDPYGVALGTYYGKKAHSLGVGNSDGYGAIFKIDFEDGTSINATLMDVKADIHTDSTNRYYDENNIDQPGGGSHFLEFVIDYDKLNSNDKQIGVMGVFGGSFPSKVSDISVITNQQIHWSFL